MYQFPAKSSAQARQVIVPIPQRLAAHEIKVELVEGITKSWYLFSEVTTISFHFRALPHKKLKASYPVLGGRIRAI